MVLDKKQVHHEILDTLVRPSLPWLSCPLQSEHAACSCVPACQACLPCRRKTLCPLRTSAHEHQLLFFITGW